MADLGAMPGRRGRPGRRSRSRRGLRSHGFLKPALTVAAFLVLVGVAILADAYYQSYRIYKDVEVVIPSLRQASDYLGKGRLPADDPFGKADDAVKRATRAVAHARFTFKLAGAIPIFGRPVQAIRHGVAAAGEVSSAALITQQAVSDLLGPAARTPRSVRAEDTPLYRGGVLNLKLLEGLGPRLERVVGHLRAADREIRAIQPFVVIPHVNEVKQQAIADATRALRLAERMRAGVRVLPAFLGSDRKMTYLIALQNEADLRGPGGALLAYGLVSVDRGRFDLLAGGSVDDLRVDPRTLGPNVPLRRVDVPLPASVAWYVDHVPKAYPWIGTVNYSPNFPEAAVAWARMVKKTTGVSIDGVIALDQSSVAAMLGTRRIRVPPFRRPITGANLVEVVSHDQYSLPDRVQIEFPAQLIAAAWPKIMDPSPLQASLQSIGESLRQKRIQLWSASPELESQLRELGWDGGVRVRPGDYLYVADSKLVSNKVDYYSRMAIDYRVSIDASGNAQATLEVALTNDSPDGLPRRIAGRPKDVGGYAVNQALMLALVPERARLLEAIPEVGLPDHLEAGAKVFARTIRVGPGETRTVRLRYAIADVVTSVAGGKLYRLVIQHQPLLTPARLTVTVILPRGTRVRAAPRGWTVRGSVLSLETDLNHDLVNEIAF